MKNNFVPISRISPDVFSLIPGYLGEDEADENLIKMTHVCRGWRELLIARPSLWAQLDCKNTDKTHVYLERSKSSPLELSLCKDEDLTYFKDALLLVVPHISRLKSLNIAGSGSIFESFTPHISCPIPLLEELTITVTRKPTPFLEATLFNGDLSSLRTLSLDGIITHLPWKNLSELTTFTLSCVPKDKISVTQLLNFFTNAHHLRDITLSHSIPTSSDALPGRVVSLPCLKNLTIDADPVHSILLNHLSIPVGTSLSQEFNFQGHRSPLPDFLPKSLGNLKNVSPVTSVSLRFTRIAKYVRLDGSSGGLCMAGHHLMDQDEPITPSSLDSKIVRSLNRFVLSGIQMLAITKYRPPTRDKTDESTPYYILLRMEDLRALTLTQCNNLPFILALTPHRNPSKRTLCPKLKELILYVQDLESYNIKELMTMAKERASAGEKLSSITIVGLGKLIPGAKVFKLKEYVTRVDYRVGEKPPRWDAVPGEEGD